MEANNRFCRICWLKDVEKSGMHFMAGTGTWIQNRRSVPTPDSKHWFTTSFLQLWKKVPDSGARSVCLPLFRLIVLDHIVQRVPKAGTLRMLTADDSEISSTSLWLRFYQWSLFQCCTMPSKLQALVYDILPSTRCGKRCSECACRACACLVQALTHGPTCKWHKLTCRSLILQKPERLLSVQT